MPTQDTPWKGALLALCALFALYLFSEAADNFGLGGRPWFGWFDGSGVPIQGKPYQLTLEQIQPGGAVWRAGLRDGDRFDLRDHDFATRVEFMDQPLATRTLTLVAHRGNQRIVTHFTGSIWSEGEWGVKLLAVLIPLLTGALCLACTIIIAVRRSSLPEGRALALALTSLGLGGVNPSIALVVPSDAASLVLWYLPCAFGTVALIAFVRMTARLGSGSRWRTLLEWAVCLALVAAAIGLGAGYLGTATLWFDPMPFWWLSSPVARSIPVIELGLVVVAAVAVARTPTSSRARAAWLLLPLPIAFATSQAALALQPYASTFVAQVNLVVAAATIEMAGAVVVTYALVKRRVLDATFIVSRTIVVGIVSLIVISAFVLLEWLLGAAVAGASHATGLIANGALALVLGLSLRYIHRRVDSLVDRVLFHKRYEDERALRAFAKEAAFVTKRDALLDQALANVRDHTDAVSAALLVRKHGTYTAERIIGDAAGSVDENDPAILALQTWHRPLDPHSYASAIRGALVLPMVARGHLMGALTLGERAGGEAYAADDIETLSEFAQGVASALDRLDGTKATRDDEILAAIAALRASIEGRLPRAQSSPAD